MNREVKITAFGLVTLLVIIGIMQPVIMQAQYQGSSQLAALGPSTLPVCNQNATEFGNYPTSVIIGQPSCLFGYVGNHQGLPEYYLLVVKLGNESTSINNKTAANAPITFENYVLLMNNQSSTFRIGSPPYIWGNGLLSSTNIGDNQRLIFELWAYSTGESKFYYTGIWNQIWINVTAP